MCCIVMYSFFFFLHRTVIRVPEDDPILLISLFKAQLQDKKGKEKGIE